MVVESATQVYQVFERYAEGSDLKVGLAIGQNDFKEEQRNLLFGPEQMDSPEFNRFQHALNPFNSDYAMKAYDDSDDFSFGCAWGESNLKRLSYIKMSHDGTSAIDILVCTPGKIR